MIIRVRPEVVGAVASGTIVANRIEMVVLLVLVEDSVDGQDGTGGHLGTIITTRMRVMVGKAVGDRVKIMMNETHMAATDIARPREEREIADPAFDIEI